MDKISNMIISIKNAGARGHESTSVPFSKLRNAIADCLVKEGYLSRVEKKVKKGKNELELGLIYNEAGRPKVSHVERISKSSRRVYFGMKDINKVRSGTGLLVLSTPKGILSGGAARKEQVGGEALFKIW
ncbi:MAG TPA: 30S ribosomal protein S8 [Candidatus Paceibacterota bacterium]